MKANDLVEAIKATANGRLRSVDTKIEVTTKDGIKLFKLTRYTYHNNTNYSNFKAVKDAVEAGLRGAPALPKWAEQFIIDGVRLVRHITNHTLYLPINFSKKETIWSNEDGKLIDPNNYNLYAKDKDKPVKSREELAEMGQGQHRRVKISNVTQIV